MKKKWFMLVTTLMFLSLMPSMASAQPAPLAPSQEAILAATRSQKFVFVLFWKENDPTTQSMMQTLKNALTSRSSQMALVGVNVADSRDKALVDAYDMTRSPLPMVLAFAPNNAITGAFPLKLTEQEISQAIVSPGMAKVMKGLQTRKLVLVCTCPSGTTTVPEGVRQFAADPRFQVATEVVSINIADTAEASLLKQMDIDPRTNVPVTVFFAPPRNFLGKFMGAVSLDQLVQAVPTSSSSGGCAGGKCGPGGCGPR